VLIDMENADTYDADEMKSQALSNAQRAFQDQESWVCCTVCDRFVLLF